MSILVVDDSSALRKIMEIYVNQMEFGRCETFNSGEAVLERLCAADPLPVTAILLDILMPGMDGIECCLKIRSMPRYKETPVVLVTAFDDEMHMQFAFEAGANDYVKKPIQRYELQVRLRNAIQLHEERMKRIKFESRLQEDLFVAQEVQQRLLTPELKTEGFQMELLHRAAATLSGDMVFSCVTGPRRRALLVMDVMGHGVAPAFVGVYLQAAAQELLRQNSDPGALLSALAQIMWEIANRPTNAEGPDISIFPAFFTAVCFDIDLEGKMLRWFNAGHVPALVRLPDGEVVDIESCSPPLGLFPKMQLRSRSMPLPQECRLLAFTDGLLDNYFASSSDGMDWTRRFLTRSAPAGGESLRLFLQEMAEQLQPVRPLQELDDLCLVAVDIDLHGKGFNDVG